MNMTENKIFDKVIEDLEFDLINQYSNISVVDYNDSTVYINFDFDFNSQFSGDVSRIKSEYFNTEADWSNIDEILNMNDLKKYVKDKGLVEKWNDSIEENEAEDLREDIYNYVSDYLNSSETFNFIESKSDELNADGDSDFADSDELINIVEGLSIVLKYDGSGSFWKEEHFMEEWEMNFIK